MRERIREALAAHDPPLLPLEDRMEAAVMLLLYDCDGEERLLFQVRTQHVEHHKGEISLPGGGRDPEDASLEATALRETHEEIGVPPEHIRLLGRLGDVPTRSNFVMSPFVGAIEGPSPYPFRHASREVDALLEVPLHGLLTWEVREWTPAAGGAVMPAFRHEEHLIFGATARVVHNFVEVLHAAGLRPAEQATR